MDYSVIALSTHSEKRNLSEENISDGKRENFPVYCEALRDYLYRWEDETP